MKTLSASGIILMALITLATLTASSNTATAQLPQIISQPSAVAIRVGTDLDQDSVLQAKRLLENKGLPYNVVSDTNTSILTTESYGLILVLGLPNHKSTLTQKTLRTQLKMAPGWFGSAKVCHKPFNIYWE